MFKKESRLTANGSALKTGFGGRRRLAKVLRAFTRVIV
jgi:hypothetical protein